MENSRWIILMKVEDNLFSFTKIEFSKKLSSFQDINSSKEATNVY